MNDYRPLFSALQALDTGRINANAFFDCILEIYTRNLKDQAQLAKWGLADDLMFGKPKETHIWYTHNGLDFFRDQSLLPNYERFISNSNIRGLTAQHTLFLRKEQQKLLHIKETQNEYRQCTEDHLNLFLYMAWMNVPDRNSLSNKTRTILNRLPYIHIILKQRPLSNSSNYDLLIADSLTNPHNQLHGVFRITEDKETLAEETSLHKILLPKKRKRRRNQATLLHLLNLRQNQMRMKLMKLAMLVELLQQALRQLKSQKPLPLLCLQLLNLNH